MKLIMSSLFMLLLAGNLFASCDKDKDKNIDNGETTKKGYITGVIKDTKGSPLAGVVVTANHTEFVASVETVTNDKGEYSLKIDTRNGYWDVKAAYTPQQHYTNQKYTYMIY